MKSSASAMNAGEETALEEKGADARRGPAREQTDDKGRGNDAQRQQHGGDQTGHQPHGDTDTDEHEGDDEEDKAEYSHTGKIANLLRNAMRHSVLPIQLGYGFCSSTSSGMRPVVW
jgi:hypothetical protein